MATVDDVWVCDVCSFVNEGSGNRCDVCGSSSSVAALNTLLESDTKAVTLQSDGWECTACTLHNKQTAELCIACGTARYSELTVDAGDASLSVELVGSSDTPLTIAAERYKVVTDASSKLFNVIEKASKTSASTFVVCAPCDHFSQKGSAGAGWACGYRNIQMLCSALMHNETYRAAMFDGKGIVPDIPTLQRWIERAWSLGYEPISREHMGGKVVNTTKWIGSSEAWALFKQFGLPVRMVAFHSFDSPHISMIWGATAGAAAAATREKAENDLLRCTGFTADQVLRPWAYHPDKTAKPKAKVTHRDTEHLHGEDASTKSSGKSLTIPASADAAIQEFMNKRHSGLIAWLRSHFGGDAGGQHLLRSSKFPVYFQHDGHSRTMIGLEEKPHGTKTITIRDAFHGCAAKRPRIDVDVSIDTEADAAPDVDRLISTTNLLILDPATSTEAINLAIATGKSWERLVKRGLHTLRKPCYEIVYVDPDADSRHGSFSACETHVYADLPSHASIPPDEP